MFSKSFLFVLGCTVGSSIAWTIPPEPKIAFNNVCKSIASAGVAACLALPVLTGPSPANAADFTGSFSGMS